VIDAGKLEACKTYIEQTKLLVTLSSAFLVAPPVVISRFSTNPLFPVMSHILFFVAEFLFIGSVLAGYFVLATIAGSQDLGTFDVHRPATRISSWSQLLLYLGGLICFVFLVIKVGSN
jgi:hypothetical protein